GRLVDGAGNGLAARALALRRRGTFDIVRSAGDGTFAFAQLAAGTFDLRLGEDPDARLLTSSRLTVAQDLDVGDLVVPTPATLRVEIVRADGSPWAGPLPQPSVFDQAGPQVWVPGKVVAGAWELEPEAGCYRIEIAGTDVVAEAQSVELAAGQ